jgi:hypothetical protein
MITNEISETISACTLQYEFSALDLKWNQPVSLVILPHKRLHYIQNAIRLHPRIFIHEMVSVVE